MTLLSKYQSLKSSFFFYVLCSLFFSFSNLLFAGQFDWESQVWRSEQEKAFWMAIPDWGELEIDIYQFRYNESGKRISSLISVPYNGYAKGYYSDQSDRFFKVVLKVVDGWIEVKKVWLPNGNKHILRSYERGVLNGRYIDWHDNGVRSVDGFSERGKKSGLWKSWHANGQKKEEGKWENGQPDGIFEEWYENGRKSAEQIFRQGKLISAVIWKPNGQQCNISRVSNGEGVVVEYDTQGGELNRNLIISGKKLASK